MTTTYFLRHGPTTENKEGRIQGQHDGTLIVADTERYLAGITPLLRSKQLHLLLSSDLRRAVETRRILYRFLQLPEVAEGTSPLLREKAMGFYEGMLWREVPELFQQQRGKEAYDYRSFGGENDEDVRARVRYALREFAVRYPNQQIGVVTHAGWLRQLVKIADETSMVQDGWTNRSAIYEAGLGPVGQLTYFHPIKIEAQIAVYGGE